MGLLALAWVASSLLPARPVARLRPRRLRAAAGAGGRARQAHRLGGPQLAADDPQPAELPLRRRRAGRSRPAPSGPTSGCSTCSSGPRWPTPSRPSSSTTRTCWRSSARSSRRPTATSPSGTSARTSARSRTRPGGRAHRPEAAHPLPGGDASTSTSASTSTTGSRTPSRSRAASRLAAGAGRRRRARGARSATRSSPAPGLLPRRSRRRATPGRSLAQHRRGAGRGGARRGRSTPGWPRWRASGAAYAAGDAAAFNRAVAELRAFGVAAKPEAVAQADHEIVFNRVEPFYLGHGHLRAGPAGWSSPPGSGSRELLQARRPSRCCWPAPSSTPRGLVSRIILQGRPPVTNLYSSAVFVGWGAVVLGVILERMYRKRLRHRGGRPRPASPRSSWPTT